jgi:hypothetical protein
MNNPRRIQRHLVRAAAVGALLAAAALPMAIATSAGAVTTPSVASLAFTPHGATANTIAAGATGTVAITGANFVDNGGNVSLATSAADVTFSSVVETSATTATADYAATAAQPAGTYSATLTDTSGSGTLTSAFTVTATPTISSLAPSPIYEGTGANTVTVTGTGFETGATVTFASTVDGTPLTATVTSISASGTSIVLSVTPTNPVNSAAATAGSFNVTVTNPDGGSATDAGGFSVTNGIQEVSPSAVAATVQASSDSVTLSGSGFEPGLTVAITPTGNCTTELTAVTVGAVTANTAVINFTETGTGVAECVISTTNPSVGGNGVTYHSAAGALGIGEASTVAPIITAATAPTTAVSVGSTGTPVTLTGAGFSIYSALSSTATGVTFSAPTASTGTSITAPVAVASGASAGAVPVIVTNTSAASAPFAAAFSVAGPAVTSSTPAAIAVGTKYGTTVTLTGTGFTPTTTLAAGTIPGGTGLAGVLSYVSATSMTFTVTTPPTAAGTATLNIVESTATGNVLTSYGLTVDPAPAISSAVTFPTGYTPTDVGVGATATTVYINGSGFETGATVGAFTNASAVADPSVTATVTKVTPTQITATIAIAAGDKNNAVGYTVTNPDGGTATTSATTYPILIGAGPTITTITPTTGTAGTTTSFAVAGTGFQAGAVVTLSPANGTCGTATVSAATTLAVTCTLGKPSSVATDLVVTNPDGGSATSTTPVLPAATVAKAPTFHVSGVHGAAVAGKTVTITISGTGFYGQPKITSTAVGSKFAVSKDNGRLLTVRATIKAGTKAGEHTLTVRLANGKSGKAGFNIKA